MGVKSTVEYSRQEAEERIKNEIDDIQKLSDETLSEILEALSEDINSSEPSLTNYSIIDDD